MNISTCKKVICFFLGIAIFTASCKKVDPIYEVEDVIVKNDASVKHALKGDRQFVSTAYSDLLKRSIPSADLNEAMNCYASVSDKEVVRDLIIRDLLRRSNLNPPSNAQMRADADAFVKDTFDRFYHRSASENEVFAVKQQLLQDTTISAVMVYYAFMTAEEYKYY